MSKEDVNLLRIFFTPEEFKKTWLLIIATTGLDLLVPLLCTILIDKAIPNNHVIKVVLLLLACVVVIIIELYLRRMYIKVTGQSSINYQIKIRRQISLNYFSKSFPEASQVEFARISTSMVQDLNLLCDLVFKKIPSSLSAAIYCLASFSILFYVDFKITLIMISCMIIFSHLVIKLKKTLSKRTAQTAESRTYLNLKIQELLRARRIIHINSMVALCVNQLKEYEREYMDCFLKSNIIVPSIQSSIEVATMLAYIILFSLYSQSGLSAGMIFLYFSYLGQIWKHFSGMMDIFNYFTSAEIYANRINQACKHNSGNITVGSKSVHDVSSIHLKNVTFGYQKGNYVLKQLNLEIPRNGLYALVGASGSGKSTIFDLLLRLRSPEDGQIMINDEEIDSLDVASLHKEIVLVQQEKVFFNQSVYDNIVLDREVSKAELLKYIDDLGASHYFESMPYGIDTAVVNYGENLSIGEKAIISLLRASCKGPSVILLDEIMANVDDDCKADLERIIHWFARDCIVILITHDLKELEKAEDYQIIKIT